MRVGIIALLHESNTFVDQTTGLQKFRDDLLVYREDVRSAFVGGHHEVSGFFEGLDQSEGVEAVPLFGARATPSGVIEEEALKFIVEAILKAIDDEPDLDGLLLAVHGAAVSQQDPDADGAWLTRVRKRVGPEMPMIATLDAHANLSQAMVDSCDALIGYRTNPHLDQHQRGLEAAQMISAILKRECRPVMAAAFPPLAISIDRQCTDDRHWQRLTQEVDQLRHDPALLSASVLLGFPYADVNEMGAATIAIADGDPELARQAADKMAAMLWDDRQQMVGQLSQIDDAMEQCERLLAESSEEPIRVCLLDMGDNVGGGSPGDGTVLAAELLRRKIGPSFVCLYDPQAVECSRQAGVGASLDVFVGGHSDQRHGEPLPLTQAIVKSLHQGRFHEDRPRHGGIVEFDQGLTAILEQGSLTVMVTSQRMVPFSSNQLVSCGLEPTQFRFLVAKGVNAPIAAYQDFCQQFLRVNTPGVTCADLMSLEYVHRRVPLFPWES